MKNWERFELNVTEYLNKIYKKSNILFESKGGSNSNISDIEVKMEDDILFGMECKLSSSQAAQFVVQNDIKNKIFLDSTKNKGSAIRRSKIIEHMNKEYKYYASSKKSKELRCSRKLMINAIREHYESKNVKFFVSSFNHADFDKNLLKIIRIQNFEDQFDISGVYRVKRSGTRDLPVAEFNDFENLITKKYKVIELEVHQGKTYLTLDHKPDNLYVSNKKYYLSHTEDNIYKVKKRSQTVNSNVIFTLKFNPTDNDNGLSHLNFEINKFK